MVTVPRDERTFGDRHCLVVRFGDDANDGTVLRRDAKTVAWVFGGEPCGNDDCCIEILPCTHPILLAPDSRGVDEEPCPLVRGYK